MWRYCRISSFLKNFMIQKVGILAIVFCGLFSNILFADSVNTEFNNVIATSFTTNPAAVGGTITICQGQSITYTDTSTGVGTNPTYAWSFPGGNITSSALAGPHTINYTIAGNYTTILSVNGSSSTVNVVVTNASLSNPVITISPNSGWVIGNFNNNNYFNYCANGSSGSLFLFSTNTINTSSTTQHIINWGDGSPNTNVTTSNIVDDFHAYSSNGLFQITYTVIQPSGCVFVNTYNVFIGINPTASIINYGLPVLCNPGSVQYSIIPGPQNTAETIYTFEVNDGTLPQTYTHAQVTSPGFLVTHFFTSISCGTGSNINGTLYPNSFQASITVSNPCGTSSSAIGPINIQSKPIANITANPSNNQICVNTSVEFTDTTSPGTNIGLSPTFTCSQNYKRYWQITGPAGLLTVGVSGVLNANPYVTVIGNLGFNANLPNNPSIWTNTATNTLNITFNLPGSYSITLFTSGTNSCGITSQTKTICVNPEVIADFTTSTLTGCAPTTVTLDNLSSLPGCTNTNLYAWQVTHTNPQNCPNASNPGWSFTSGTASSFEPEITFTSAGVYTIQLTTSLQNAITGTLCQPDIKTKTITIKDKPKTTLTSQTICEGTTIILNPTVFNCYATQAVTYLWDFGSNPPTSISSTTSSSPTVTFATAGTYNYTLTLTNECGSNTFSSSIIVNPAVQISASGPSATCLNTGIPLTGSITGGATTGTWTASITGGTFSPSITVLSPTYSPPTNYTGTITFTLTSDDPTGPCPAKTISFQVVVNAQATADAGTYNPICQNVSLQLNGIVGGAASSGSWTSSNGGTFSDPTSLTSTYTPPPGFVGTIVLTLTTNDPPGPCNPEIDTVTISVIQTPTINTLSNIVVCHNENIGPISFSGTSDTNYSWTNSNPAIGLVPFGTSAISFVGTNNGNTPIIGTITVTPFNTSGGTSCPGTPTTFTITINPKGQVNTIPSQVVCNGDTVTLADLSTTNIGGTTTYAWTSSNTAVGLTTSGNGNIPLFTAVNTTTAPVSTTITVTPTFENGGVSCSGTPKTITITVNPTGQVNQPNDLIFCAGTASTAIPFTTTNTSGTTSYTWTNDTLGIGLSASGIGNIPVFTPINNTTNPIVATITITPTFTDGGKSCIGSSKTFTITINPRGQVNNVSNIVVCNGDIVPALSFSTNISNGTTIFNWVNNTPSIGLISNGTDTMPSFTAVNNSTTPITATITVTPQYTNSITCNGTPITYTIIVNPSATVATVTNKTVCNGVVLAAINFATPNISGTTTYTWINDTPSIGLAASGTGNISAFSVINTGTSPIIATIQVTPSYTNNGITCSGASTSFTITVNPTAQVNPITNQILCNGITTAAVTFSTNNSGGTTTYNWTNSNTAIGLAASGSGTINAFNATNNTANAISGTITVTPNFSNGTPDCTGPSQTFAIIVNPSPAIVFSSANQIICSGDTSALVSLSSTTSGATFTWTATQPIGITGVTTSGTNTIPVQNLVNTTNLPITITYTAVAETNDASACEGSTFNYTITVTPRPSITESFTDAICSGSTFSIIPTNSTLNSIPTGTTYSWNAPIVTGAITGGASGLNQSTIGGTLVNPTNTVQTATYSVTPIFNNCTGTAFTVVISVNPKPAIASVTPAAICSESAFSVTPTNGSGNIVPTGTTYTWTISTNTNITGATVSTATGISTISQTLTNISNTAQTITYNVTPTSGDSGNCVGSNFTITVVVNPKPTVLSTTRTICSGTVFSVIPTNGSGNIVPTGTTYTWTTPISDPVGAITGGTAQGTGIATISQTLTNTTTAPATLEYTVTPTSGTCAGTPFTITVTVNPTPTTLGLTNQTYCNGIPTTEIVLTNGVSGTTYEWTNSNAAIGLAISGTGNIPVFTPTNSSTAPITATISIIATANNCSRVAETYTITVNPSPAVSFSPTNQTICSGDSSALVTLSSTTSGATFTWTAVQPNGITGVTTSGTNTIPVQTLVNTTNAPITITYAAVAATNDASACAGITYNYTITVTPRPSITESFTDAICSGGSFSITPANSTLNSIPTGTTYSWSAPIVSSGITGGASGVNQTTIAGTLINSTNTVQTATYTVTPIFNSCTGTAFTVVISVNPKPAIASVTPAAICSESAFSVTPTNGSGNIVPTGTTYTWTISTNTNITGATVSTATGISTISQTLTNISNTAQTITYNVTPTSGDSGNCVGSNFTITVVVNPKPTVLSTTRTICSGTVFSVIPTNGSGNIVPTGTTYTWTTPISDPVGAITGGTAQGTGIATISQTLTNTTTAPATLEYTVTPTSGTCAGTPFTITVTVNPTPTTLGLTNQTYCNGIPTTEIVLTNGVSGTTYEWTNSNAAIGLAISGTGNIPVFTPTNSSTAPITATISIIATANNCSRVAETYTITVNPSPAVSFSPTNQTICSGDTSALVTLSSTTSGATFTWTATQPIGITGVTTSGTNTIPVQNLVNTTNLPITITYTAVAETNDASACTGSTFNYTITVNPKPAIENQVLVICSGTGFTISPIDGIPNTNTIVPTGTTYTWTISTNSNIIGASAGSGSQISQVLTNASTTIQTIIYTVTPTSGTCIGTPFTITVEVYPKPNVIFDLANQTICNNTTTNLVTLSSSLPGAITFAWIANIPSGITGATASGTGNIPVETLVNSTNAPLTITYTASATFTSNGNSCTGNDAFYTITVNPTFTASGVLSNYNGYNVSVFGGNDGTINLTVAGGSGTYTYSWVGPNGFTAITEDLMGLFAGTYTVTINDGYCAPIVLTFILTQPPELLVQQDLALNINLICFGNSNGAVGIQITQESVSPYDYTLLNSANVIVQTITDSTNLNPQFTGLIAGTYSVLVTDANGGTKTVTGLVVSQPDDIAITPTITEITCYGANNASISLAVTGGTAPYIANWNTLATGFFQNNLAAGSYTITITDANGCTKPITINIIEAPIFTINPVVTNISCFGANNGSINLNLIGGQAPVVVTWNDGSTSGTIRNNLIPGVYSVSISDGTPCYINRTFIIVEPQPLILNATVQNALDCFNASSGAINLVVSGGTPPFSYVWSNGATTEDLSNIPNGNYSVIVTDSRGCINTASFAITRPSPLTLVLDQDSQVNCATGTITTLFKANISGGMPPFTINWSSGTVSGTNNEFMSTTQNGLITVTITDANGCATSQSVTISNPIIGNAGFTQNSYAFTTFGLYSIQDPIQFTNTATGDYISISWNFGDGTFSTEENPIHTYVLEGDYVVTQTVTYPLGCIKTTFISLIIEKGYLLVVPSAFTPNNDSLNDTFRPVTKGLKNVRLDIYDTWGSLIYSETGDVIAGWNGKIKDIPAENGNYYSKVTAETFYGTIVNENQTFVLIK
jgi:large repetitive protein